MCNTKCSCKPDSARHRAGMNATTRSCRARGCNALAGSDTRYGRSASTSAANFVVKSAPRSSRVRRRWDKRTAEPGATPRGSLASSASGSGSAPGSAAVAPAPGEKCALAWKTPAGSKLAASPGSTVSECSSTKLTSWTTRRSPPLAVANALAGSVSGTPPDADAPRSVAVRPSRRARAFEGGAKSSSSASVAPMGDARSSAMASTATRPRRRRDMFPGGKRGRRDPVARGRAADLAGERSIEGKKKGWGTD